MYLRDEIDHDVLETIISILMDLENVNTLMELDDLIDDPRGGYVTLDVFFDTYGQPGAQWDSDTIITITDDEEEDPTSVTVVNHAVADAIFYTPDDVTAAYWVLELMRDGEIGVFPVHEEEMEDDLSTIVMDWDDVDSLN